MTVRPDPRLELVDVLARAADPESFDACQRRARATGWCRNPFRLTGSSHRVNEGTGEIAGTFASTDLPDRVLLKACGQRRAARCPTCSATYQADAYQLVTAGLRGGKGVPDTIASHPMVFVTLTAPSFGAVHTCHQKSLTQTGPWHPGTGTCRHGLPRGCGQLHPPDDSLLGQPICPDCFDYTAAVLWNAHAGELWRCTTIAINRTPATCACIPRSQLRDHVRLAFTKVTEYQRRGSVHIHAVIRLDATTGPVAAPADPLDTGALATAVSRAVAAVSTPVPATAGAPEVLRWGPQLDIQAIGKGGRPPTAVGGYLAKHATKSTDPDGILDRRLNAGDVVSIYQLLNPHLARMVRTAWDLGSRPELDHLHLRAWAHTLGFRGHWLTKRRRYSTTLAALRAARHQWNLHHHGEPPGEAALSVVEWRYAGRGWASGADPWLAETAAGQASEQRRVGRQETSTTGPMARA